MLPSSPPLSPAVRRSFQLLSVVMFGLGLACLALYIRDDQPAVAGLLAGAVRSVRDTGPGKVRLGLILQMLAGVSLILDIAGEVRLEKWGQQLRAASAYAASVKASLIPSDLFVEGSPAVSVIYLGLFGLTLVESVAAYWAARAELTPAAPPGAAWFFVIVVFLATNLFLPVFTRLVIRFAANCLHFVAARLLPVTRLVGCVVLPLFLIGSVLQFFGT